MTESDKEETGHSRAQRGKSLNDWASQGKAVREPLAVMGHSWQVQCVCNRTDVSANRTDLSANRTDVKADRTDVSADRTDLSADAQVMAHIRIAVLNILTVTS